MKEIDIDKCKIKATLVDGTIIQFKVQDLQYDSFDGIYWYQGKSLEDIKIIVNEEF